jgi:predicted TIM-barrel fold metal-dependent hydrolase
MDLDSHEMIPMNLWDSVFGEAGAQVVDLMGEGLRRSMPVTFFRRDDSVIDEAEITEDTVWNLKGADAPSALDLTRRPAVLDQMGIGRQLVFPGFALLGLVVDRHPEAHKFLRLELDENGLAKFQRDKALLGRAVIDAHNEWAIGVIRATGGDRVRPVALVPTSSVDDMIESAEYLIANGVRGIWIPGGIPPAGVSPGDRRMDPLWQLAEKTNTALLAHIGFETSFMSSQAWGANVPQFVSNIGSNLEFMSEPLAASTSIAYASETFLAAMILSGVFERYPGLRFGVIECAAYWVGALGEKLDLMAGQFPTRMGNALSMRPSEYLNRNVRVTAYSFEPIDRYFERFPELADVYCFSTDYPHTEGGKDSKRVVHAKIARLGDDVVEKYFVTNGQWLLPD